MFLGTQVSNWNEARVEREQAREYRARLIEAVNFNALQLGSQRAYYQQAKAYGERALASLNGAKPLSDRDFLVAAHQLSQTDTSPAKTYIYDEMTANGMVTRLGDAKLQQAASNYYLGLSVSNRIIAETLPYRSLIREVMPYDIQKAIRAACGDREVRQDGRLIGVKVVVPCPVRIEPGEAAAAARTVRMTPRIERELTRYLSSLDEKLDQLGPTVDYSGAIKRAISDTVSP